MNKIFLYDTERSLLIFLLMNNFLDENITYFFSKDVLNLEALPGKKIFLPEIGKIEKLKFFESLIVKNFYIKKVRRKYRNIFNLIEKKNVSIYGLGHTFLSSEIFYKEDLFLLEDGLLNYIFLDLPTPNSFKKGLKNIISLLTKFLFGLKIRKQPYGQGNSIKKIYLTGLASTPKEIEEKVEIIDLKKLWKNKNQKEKEIILKTFEVDLSILEKINKDTIMLFTQPLSEDTFISEREKIDLYSKILKKYPNQSVIIKIHPREITDYSKYFPNCYVMKEKYPVEILGLMDINIKKVVTIFSTAVFGFNNIPIDFYGTEINQKLFSAFGSQDKLKKRNAFL